VTITATDACGNSSQLAQTISLGDGDLPTFEGMMEELYVECGQIPAPHDDFGDSCISELLDVTVEETYYSGACQPTIERLYTATSPCGHTSSFTQYIFIQDTQAPVFLNQPQHLSGVCGDAIPVYLPRTRWLLVAPAPLPAPGLQRMIAAIHPWSIRSSPSPITPDLWLQALIRLSM
jgi:hypothetical protein